MFMDLIIIKIPHYIVNEQKDNTERRIILKTHYLIYPKGLQLYGKFLGFITILYNYLFRNLFLFTIKPNNFSTKILTYLMIFVIDFSTIIGTYIGFDNIGYLLFLNLLFGYNSQYFLYLTSFLHYLKYIYTYHYRSDITHFLFIRDCILYKTISYLQLIILYLNNFSWLPLIPLICGNILSLLASSRL